MKKPFAFTRKFLIVFLRVLAMTAPIWGVILLIIVGLSWFYAEVEKIGLWNALYFGSITALTIGYGDIHPLTAAGKAIAVTMGILGVITTGIIVAVALQAIRIAYEEMTGTTDKTG